MIIRSFFNLNLNNVKKINETKTMFTKNFTKRKHGKFFTSFDIKQSKKTSFNALNNKNAIMV